MKDGRIDQIEQIDDQSIRPKPKVKSGDVANYDTRMISAKKTPEESRYPIHYLVWYNKHRQLEKELETSKQVRQRRAPMGGGICSVFYIFYSWWLSWVCESPNDVDHGARRMEIPLHQQPGQ